MNNFRTIRFLDFLSFWNKNPLDTAIQETMLERIKHIMFSKSRIKVLCSVNRTEILIGIFGLKIKVNSFINSDNLNSKPFFNVSALFLNHCTSQ